ncbi:MAG: RluA family pseudouridine synthase [Puniceicoccaceae bacterium]|nr:RluA family pseudouridine synthase [Puniceicoccaceae bacterium]
MNESEEEKSALQWLAEKYPNSPKKRLKEWFANGRIQLDGAVITKPHLRLRNPQGRLLIENTVGSPKVFFKQMPTRIHAQVNLLYIDSALAIVNKGPGLLSVPLSGQSQPSALTILEKYLQGKGSVELAQNRIKRNKLQPLPVHRLDQYTSGLLCFAMTQQAREKLVRQVREHSFLREYIGLGDGALKQKKGTWRSWFKLDEEGIHQTVYSKPFDGATEAISTYQVVDTIEWPTRDGGTHVISRLRLRLKTGLKHQLRIHAAHANTPLLGDRHYHPDYIKAAKAGTGMPHGFKRQALHASSIGFIHPESGEMRRFNSKFPRDLSKLEENLRAR